MKNYSLYIRDICSDKMFEYPCFNSNINFLKGKKVSVFGDNYDCIVDFFKSYEASVTPNPDNKGTSFTQIGVVLPKNISEDTEQGYYQILDYYVETLQLLIHKMTGVDEFTHIVVILPYHADEIGSSFIQMANYAVYGLVKGLGELNAPRRIFINGIIPSENTTKESLNNWVRFLSSNNANNVVGQVIKL